MSNTHNNTKARIAKMELMRRAHYCPEARAALRAIYEKGVKK